jgi:hypothetical protein
LPAPKRDAEEIVLRLGLFIIQLFTIGMALLILAYVSYHAP